MGSLVEAALVAELSDEVMAVVSIQAVESSVERPIRDCKRVASLDPTEPHGPR